MIRFLMLSLILALASVALPASAQSYPVKPIRIVLPVSPGAGTDFVARLVAERLQAGLGQPAIIEHRAGAGGNIGGETVFRAAPDGYTLLLTGQVDMMFAGLSSALPQARERKLRMLAIGSEKRNAALPDLPALAEQLPGFAAENWFGLLAPPATPATPAAIANRVSGVIAESMKQPDVIKRLEALSLDAVGSTPAELAALIRLESDRWAKVIRATSDKAE